MYGNDILSVVFLTIICVIISGIIVKYTPHKLHLVVPSVALISIILWIAYDYILQRRDQAKRMTKKKPTYKSVSQLIYEINTAQDPDDRVYNENGGGIDLEKQASLSDSSDDSDATNMADEGHNNRQDKYIEKNDDKKQGNIQPPFYLKNPNQLKLVKFDNNEFDIDYYSDPTKEFDIRQVYNEMGGDGDTALCNRMKYQGMQAKLSKDIRSIYNKHSAEPYFIEELREQENRHWYEATDETYGPL